MALILNMQQVLLFLFKNLKKRQKMIERKKENTNQRIVQVNLIWIQRFSVRQEKEKNETVTGLVRRLFHIGLSFDYLLLKSINSRTFRFVINYKLIACKPFILFNRPGVFLFSTPHRLNAYCEYFNGKSDCILSSIRNAFSLCPNKTHHILTWAWQLHWQ